MKPPTFSAISAIRSSSDADSTEIALTDANGNTQNIKLSAQAHTQLISALLSTPPVRIGNDLTMRPVHAVGVRAFHLQSGACGLEFLVGQSAAIHIAFPQQALPQLLAAIGNLENPTSPPKAH